MPWHLGWWRRRGVNDLGVTTETVSGAVVVEVSGEIDLHTAPTLRAALAAAVDAAGGDQPAVVVDLTGVGFIDSTGLGELVAAHKALADKGARLHLAASNERVRRLLSITGVDEVLAVHADRTAAVAAVTRT
jgi:anti-sigma B factor antagonist